MAIGKGFSSALLMLGLVAAVGCKNDNYTQPPQDDLAAPEGTEVSDEQQEVNEEIEEGREDAAEEMGDSFEGATDEMD